MLQTPRARACCLLVAVVLLAGSFVAFGALEPAPDRNHVPDQRDVAADPTAHVGETVSFSGTVVATDPIVVEARDGFDEPYAVTLAGVDESVTVGQHVRTFGTLRDGETVAVSRVAIVEPWQRVYMYAISALAGLWVLVRFLRGWRVDGSAWGFARRVDGSETDA